MGLFEFVIFLFIKPFSLMKAAFLLGARILCITLWVWLQLFKAFVSFQADLCTKFVLWSIAFLTLPIRVLTAIHRERMLEMSLQELQVQLGDLVWENKELEERVKLAISDKRVMQTVFTEIEDDYENALSRIEQLENELQVLKDENLRLHEVQGKSNWSYKSEKDDEEVHAGIPVCDKHRIPSWDSGYDKSDIYLAEMFDHGDTWGDETKGKHQHQDILKVSPHGGFETDESLYQRRNSALSQSLFSAILSLLVGAIIWEAEDPCAPLVAALFIVVGMSLSSVVQFFSTIKNKPASDAVALLSFNWFMLGTLTSPTLPHVGRMLASHTLSLASRALGWS